MWFWNILKGVSVTLVIIWWSKPWMMILIVSLALECQFLISTIVGLGSKPLFAFRPSIWKIVKFGLKGTLGVNFWKQSFFFKNSTLPLCLKCWIYSLSIVYLHSCDSKGISRVQWQILQTFKFACAGHQLV